MILSRFLLVVASSLTCRGVWGNNENDRRLEQIVVKSEDDDFKGAESSLETPDDFNAKYCTTTGCKPVTNVLMSAMMDSSERRNEFIARNQIVDPLFNLPSEMKPALLHHTVPYLGVLLDAGQHYYPIEWIRNLLQLMHALGYNLLHLRLTDDHAFNMELTSMPELANPALDSDGRVYQATELKDLVTYAASLNITIMPEIDIPGHAGGWAGNHTPTLMVPCPRHICNSGHDLRLNRSHPKVKQIVRAVLVEVLDIFYTTPFLHLGAAEESDLTSYCLREARENGYEDMSVSFDTFLRKLIAIELKRVSILRWTSLNAGFTGEITLQDEESPETEQTDDATSQLQEEELPEAVQTHDATSDAMIEDGESLETEPTYGANIGAMNIDGELPETDPAHSVIRSERRLDGELAVIESTHDGANILDSAMPDAEPMHEATNDAIILDSEAPETEYERFLASAAHFENTGVLSRVWSTQELQDVTNPTPAVPSMGLYLDATSDHQAFEIFESTRDITRSQDPGPIAFVVETLELGAHQWLDANVIGRLITVALGSSDRDLNQTSFDSMYHDVCRDQLNLDERICEHQGLPILSRRLFRSEVYAMRSDFREELCSRLTTREIRQVILSSPWKKKQAAQSAMNNFWFHFADDRPKFSSSPLPVPDIKEEFEAFRFLRNHQEPHVEFRGISLDLGQIEANDLSVSRILSTLDLMHVLNLNTLQLRILSDVGFAIAIPKNQHLVWDTGFTIHEVSTIVKHAHSLGIQVIPEITTATRAGGWFEAGVLANCPKVLSQYGVGMGANATDSDFLANIVSVLLGLVEQFDHPPFIHLGFDEREEVKACYDEAELVVDLDEFERRLTAALKFQDFNESKLIRWENSEGILYPERAGRLTHYRLSKPLNSGEPFFISSGLQLGNPSTAVTDAWSIYKQTRKLVSYQPTGIVAIVDLVDEAFWIDLAISQRLVAYAVGLSSPDLSKSDFEKYIVETLAVLGVQENLAGIVVDPKTALSEQELRWELRKNYACDYVTISKSRVVGRKGWLVEKDGDSE